MMENVLESIEAIEDTCTEIADNLEVRKAIPEHSYKLSESITNEPRDQRY